MADLLGSERVVFPPNASVLSAFGTLVSPIRIDLARSMPRALDTLDPAERDVVLGDLRDEATRVLTAAGASDRDIGFRYGLDARYLGQGNEITIWVDEGESWTTGVEQVREAFEDEYRRIYGLAIPDIGIEVVTWRLAALSMPTEFEPYLVDSAEEVSKEPTGRRPVVFARGASPVDTPVYRRIDLMPGLRVNGPAIVEERETTSVIHPGWSAAIRSDGCLVAVREGP